MATDPKRKDDLDRETKPPASPYGPQPDGPDDAAGGADSSPFDNMSSDERAELLKNTTPAGGPNDGRPK
jgi:hypothetical protein